MADNSSAPESSSGTSAANEQSLITRVQQQFENLNKKQIKEKYAFWETQPVVQFAEGAVQVGLLQNNTFSSAFEESSSHGYVGYAGRWPYR
jgi:hypothetical protein